MLVVNRRQNSSLLSKVTVLILIYFHTLPRLNLKDDGVLASNMTDIGLQFHQPITPTKPITLFADVLQKFPIVERRAE